MRRSSKTLALLATCAAVLSGCATTGYDDYYAYDDGYYGRPYRYYDAPTYYYGPVYPGPRVGFGLSYHRGWWR